jgi:hypothetical protein
MNYQMMHFDPYRIDCLNQHHEELIQGVEALRLEKRLRENRRGQASRLTAFLRRTRCGIGQSLQGSLSPSRCR